MPILLASLIKASKSVCACEARAEG